MASVGSKDTGPELAVRGMLHALGYRYRLHVRGLPGKPDLVFAKRRKVVFVHGCFWHGHGCKFGRLPKSRQEFWSSKIEKNRRRDEAAIEALSEKGWDISVVWQCELKDLLRTRDRIVAFLEAPIAIAIERS